jgi:hypothetical protein
MTAADVVTARIGLLRLTERLVADYQGTCSAETVIRTVAGCRDELRRMGLEAGLMPALEAMARTRLDRRLCAA